MGRTTLVRARKEYTAFFPGVRAEQPVARRPFGSFRNYTHTPDNAVQRFLAVVGMPEREGPGMPALGAMARRAPQSSFTPSRLAFSVLGRVSSSMPSLKLALALEPSTVAG